MLHILVLINKMIKILNLNYGYNKIYLFYLLI